MHDLTLIKHPLAFQWLKIARPKGLNRQCNIVISPDPSTSRGYPVRWSAQFPLNSINSNIASWMESSIANTIWGSEVILWLGQMNLTHITLTMGECLPQSRGQPAAQPGMPPRINDVEYL
jgi:hypothetical protein